MERIVLVTGGSRGIGKAICREFAKDGGTVVINYSSSESEAMNARNELSQSNGKIFIEKADISDSREAHSLIDSVVERFGRLDVLVNNAGIVMDGFLMLMSDKDWNDVITTNLTGVFNCSKAASGYMIEQRKGVIINMTSLSGINAPAGQTNYAASKGGVIAFTRALSKELAHFGIRVNAVAPGVIETDIINSLNEKTRAEFLTNIPLRRFGKPEEVACVVRFLASEDAGYITGEVISVTGGLY